jgi:hypothetical protein
MPGFDKKGPMPGDAVRWFGPILNFLGGACRLLAEFLHFTR